MKQLVLTFMLVGMYSFECWGILVPDPYTIVNKNINFHQTEEENFKSTLKKYAETTIDVIFDFSYFEKHSESYFSSLYREREKKLWYLMEKLTKIPLYKEVCIKIKGFLNNNSLSLMNIDIENAKLLILYYILVDITPNISHNKYKFLLSKPAWKSIRSCFEHYIITYDRLIQKLEDEKNSRKTQG